MGLLEFLKSRWFPPILALLVSLLHLALICWGYWAAVHGEKRFDLAHYIRQDLARPLSESNGFCAAWIQVSPAESAALGLDLPAYLSTSLVLSLVTRGRACYSDLVAPRGQILTWVWVPFFWYGVGSTVRRWVRGLWQNPSVGIRNRLLNGLGFVTMPAAIVTLLMAIFGLFFSPSSSFRLAGFSFWTLYIYALFAERSRQWPFRSI